LQEQANKINQNFGDACKRLLRPLKQKLRKFNIKKPLDHGNSQYTLSRLNNTTIFCAPQASLVGKTTKNRTQMQHLCGVRSLISIIISLRCKNLKF